MPQQPRFTDNEILNLAQEGYLYELRLLITIIKSELFSELLPLFTDYEMFLKYGVDQYVGKSALKMLQDENHVIDASISSGFGSRLFTCANLAAACEIFSGWTVPAGELNIEQAPEYLQMAINHGRNTQENLGQSMAMRLNNGDAVRVSQSLKLLGLVSADTSKSNQLALGASIARRDRHGFHLVPWIGPANPAAMFTVNSPLQFAVKPREPNSIVIMDNDSSMKPVYEKLNIEEQGQVQAMNLGFYEGLDVLAQLVSDNEACPRGLVTAYRLEPRAFTDIELFLAKLGKVIDQSADFVITIGSGDNADEFKHRIDVLNAIAEGLSARGMGPIRLKLCKGKTYDDQRNQPVYGLNQYASYEVLYCKLDRSKMN